MKLLLSYVFLSLYALNFLGAQHISEFVSLAGGNQTSDFIHPPEHTFQYIIEEGDPLDNGGTAANKFDFTGYVPISGSSESGYLSISHENTPGGVSILDIQFDAVKQSWSYTSAIGIDFNPVNGTARNCSGTVTPWNTIVTCEEQIIGDNNGDTYNDIGWSIEIDPATKQIVDYPNGLSGADKMWALGNFKHENIVVHSNQRTVYQAEDSGAGHLYKFVANTAGDLSSGDLYVYVGPKNGNGNWVQLNNNTPAEQNSTIAQANAVSATDFAGGEDVEINPIDGKIYVAVKNEQRVYRFSDDSPLSGGTVSNFETYVGALTYPLTTANGIVNVPWGTGNDNLAFDDLGNLWVLQDGSNNHIWLVENGHSQSNPKVKIYGRTPAGSEPTGMTFSPDYRFIFMSFQHPNSSNSSSSQPDAFQNLKLFDKDVAVVIARKEHLGNCHKNLTINYPLSAMDNFQVSDYITSTALLSPTANISYFAGDSICLQPNFQTVLGANFLAEIMDCTVNQP